MLKKILLGACLLSQGLMQQHRFFDRNIIRIENEISNLEKKVSYQTNIEQFDKNSVQIFRGTDKEFFNTLYEATDEQDVLERWFINYKGQRNYWIELTNKAYLFKQGRRKGSAVSELKTIHELIREMQPNARDLHIHPNLKKVVSCFEDPNCDVPKKIKPVQKQEQLQTKSKEDIYAKKLDTIPWRTLPSISDLKSLIGIQNKYKNQTIERLIYNKQSNSITTYSLTEEGKNYFQRLQDDLFMNELEIYHTKTGHKVKNKYLSWDITYLPKTKKVRSRRSKVKNN
jgi:hypothetical protein